MLVILVMNVGWAKSSCPPRFRHCDCEHSEAGSNPVEWQKKPGLLRRFTPRNDEFILFDHPTKFMREHYMLQENLSDHPFWRFSAKLLEQENLLARLTKLEQQFNLNPNILLFCCWFANSGQGRITKANLQTLQQACTYWHEQIVLPLQTLTHKLKTSPAAALAQLYPSSQTELFSALHIEQLLLIDAELNPAKHHRNDNLRLMDACKNIEQYCKLATNTINQTLFDSLYNLIASSFPAFDSLVAQRVCHSILQAEPIMLNFAQSQLSFS